MELRIISGATAQSDIDLGAETKHIVHLIQKKMMSTDCQVMKVYFGEHLLQSSNL